MSGHSDDQRLGIIKRTLKNSCRAPVVRTERVRVARDKGHQQGQHGQGEK